MSSSEVKLYPVQSSYLDKVGYDAPSKTLHIVFRDGDHYTYHGVSREAFNALQRARSPGSHFREHIKGHHPATKVTGQ
jgi:hypothetical protein